MAPATAQLEKRIACFPVGDVRLTESPFKHAQEMDICYLLGLDPDRLLAPYRKEAGLTPKAPNYGNWENSGLDGHIGGHYLSALSYMYAATGNSEIKTRLDYMLDELQTCQEAAGDGYLCGVPGGRAMWEEIARGNIRASRFDLNGKWVPLYNIHKTFAGLRDACLQTGSSQQIYRWESTGQLLGHSLANEPYAYGKYDPVIRHGLRIIYALYDSCRTSLGEAFQPGYFIGFQMIQVGYIIYQSVLIKQIYRLRPKTVYIHSFAAYEMLDAPFYLGRAFHIVRTIIGHFVVISHKFGSANRTCLYEFYLTASGQTLFHID